MAGRAQHSLSDHATMTDRGEWSEPKQEDHIKFETFEEHVINLCVEIDCAFIVSFTIIGSGEDFETGHAGSARSYKTVAPSQPLQDNLIRVFTVYEHKQLKALHIIKQRLPHEIVTIFATLIPSYQFLSILDIRRCRVDELFITDLSALLRNSYVTHLCLDGTRYSRADYSLLLAEESKLTHLSLARCNIRDDVVRRLMLRLQYGSDAADRLEILNLTGNYITDVGATYIGTTLKLNMTLRYLNLAGNYISDFGASDIFEALDE